MPVGAGATPIGPAPTCDRKNDEGRRGDIGRADVTRIRHDDLDPGSGFGPPLPPQGGFPNPRAPPPSPVDRPAGPFITHGSTAIKGVCSIAQTFALDTASVKAQLPQPVSRRPPARPPESPASPRFRGRGGAPRPRGE